MAPSRIDGRRAAGLRNRARLVAAAETLFAERGYESVTTREITAAAGVALGTFHNHFKDKEDLFRTCFKERAVSTFAARELRRRKATSFSEFVKAYFGAHFEYIFKEPIFLALYRRNIAVIRDIILSDGPGQRLAELTAVIQAFVDQGEVQPSLDAELVATTIMALTFELGAVIAQRTPPDPQAAAEFAAGLVLNGVAWRPDAASCGGPGPGGAAEGDPQYL